MKKLIYVVKRGRKTGIYDEWKKCYEQTNRFPGSLYRSFSYMAELEREDEKKEGSLWYAFRLAEQYMSEIDIGGFKLVYQGRQKDYPQEDSWKQEGFLPFGEENPLDTDHIDEEEKSDKTKSDEAKASFKQLAMHAESIGVGLKNKVIGQDDAIDKLERAFFHAEKRARLNDDRKGPRNVYLFAAFFGQAAVHIFQNHSEIFEICFKRRSYRIAVFESFYKAFHLNNKS